MGREGGGGVGQWEGSGLSAVELIPGLQLCGGFPSLHPPVYRLPLPFRVYQMLLQRGPPGRAGGEAPMQCGGKTVARPRASTPGSLG